MDAFDKKIVSAQRIHEPSANFVEETMQRIEHTRSSRAFTGWKLWGTLSGVALVAVLAVIVTLGDQSSPSQKAASTALATTSDNTAASPPANKNASVPAGTDNTTLASDLDNVGTSMNQESTDQGSANNALNDSQQQITVPTN